MMNDALINNNTGDKNASLLVVVAGPTASGKTATGIELATYFNAVILSADSRQCYRELNIGVAKPSPAELSLVKHYFIDSHSIHEPVDAASFAGYGLSVLETLFEKHRVVIAVGGTGLYIKALCEGVDNIPKVPEHIRQQVISLYETHGINGLQQKLSETDSRYFQEGEIQNPQRVMRALEVSLFTGKSIRDFQLGVSQKRAFRVLYFGMDVPREKLHTRVNRRVDEMMAAGLLKEAEQLFPYRHLNALQTVGYTEFFDYFEGKCSLEEAVELVKIHTRQYAKRQVTWFKKVPGMHWIAPDSVEEMKRTIDEYLNNRTIE